MKQKMASISKNEQSPLGSTRVLETSRRLLASLKQHSPSNLNQRATSTLTFGKTKNLAPGRFSTQPRKRNVSLEKSLNSSQKLYNGNIAALGYSNRKPTTSGNSSAVGSQVSQNPNLFNRSSFKTHSSSVLPPVPYSPAPQGSGF